MMNFVMFCDIQLGSRQHKLNQVEKIKQECDNLLKIWNELKVAVQNGGTGHAQKEIQMVSVKQRNMEGLLKTEFYYEKKMNLNAGKYYRKPGRSRTKLEKGTR